MRSVLIGGLALLLAACGGAPALTAAPSASGSLGAMGADGFFDLSGNPVSLSADLGSPVVLAFLSPADGDSGAELPLLIRLAGAYQVNGVGFVVVGEGASATTLAQWASADQLPFPVWQDPTGTGLTDRGFSGVPDTQFIDRRGDVVASEAGFLSRGQLLEGLARID